MERSEMSIKTWHQVLDDFYLVIFVLHLAHRFETSSVAEHKSLAQNAFDYCTEFWSVKFVVFLVGYFLTNTQRSFH